MPSGFQINGIDIVEILATGNGVNTDISNFRTSFQSTLPPSLQLTKFSPDDCVISNSPATKFDCYRVPTTFADNRYETPTNTTGDWSELAGNAMRWNGNEAAVKSPGPVVNAATVGPQTTYGPYNIPPWCNKVLIYSVGGGGGGGAKGADAPSANSGNGANGTNGLAVVAEVSPVAGLTYNVIVGGGGGGGFGTGNSVGAGAVGTPSYVKINGTDYAIAKGGVGGNQGNSAPGVFTSGNNGFQQSATPTTSSSNAASNPPSSYPPTLQVVAARYNRAGIGSFGPGNVNENNNTGNNTPGVSGAGGMVAIFFKNN